MHRVQFKLFRDIGVHLFGFNRREALQFAMNRMALPESAVTAVKIDPQLIMNLEAAIARTKKNSSP